MALSGERLQTFARVVEPGLGPGGAPIPVLGLSVVPDLISGPGGILPDDRFSWDEIGDGFYGVYLQTLASDSSGEYEVHFHVTDPYQSAFTQTWTLFGVTAGSSLQGISRRELRRSVAHQLYDLADATAWNGGQTGQFTDPINFARETNYFKGMQALFSSPESPNYGRLATVTRSDGPTRTIFFEPPLQNVTLPGEKIELYNFRGRGNTVEWYNHSINDAIRIAREQHAVLPWKETLVDAIGKHGQILIPETFTQVSGVRFLTYDGSTYTVRPKDMEIDRFSRSIELKGQALYMGLGKYPTILGFARPSLLDHDDARTLIDPEWLFNEVKAQVLERNVASGMPIGSQDRLFLQERTESGGKRTMVVSRVPPNTVRLV